MSGEGAPNLSVPKVNGARVGIVASSWHGELMDLLIDGAKRACAEANATVSLVRVPGSFELPLVCQKVAKTHQAVVALGVVIRGGTPHFDYVCNGLTYGLTRVSLKSHTPIGFGVLTCDDEAQAYARAGGPGSEEDKGHEAAMAAMATLHTLTTLR